MLETGSVVSHKEPAHFEAVVRASAWPHKGRGIWPESSDKDVWLTGLQPARERRGKCETY